MLHVRAMNTECQHIAEIMHPNYLKWSFLEQDKGKERLPALDSDKNLFHKVQMSNKNIIFGFGWVE